MPTLDQLTAAFTTVNGRVPTGEEVVALRAHATEDHFESVQRAFGDLGPAVVGNMMVIMSKESGGRSDARKNDEVEDSRGLFQINTRAHPGLGAKYDLADPAQNAQAAREVFDRQGYGAWYTAAKQLGLVDNDSAPQTPRGASLPSSPLADPATAARQRKVQGLQAQDAFSRKLIGQIGEVPEPGYVLPGPPKIDLGWGSPYQLRRRR